VQLSEAEAAAV
jgi:hypothetical protein